MRTSIRARGTMPQLRRRIYASNQTFVTTFFEIASAMGGSPYTAVKAAASRMRIKFSLVALIGPG
jgi:hypothetical protein